MIKVKINPKSFIEPINENAYYKLCILLSIIYYNARGGKASFLLINLVFWSLRSVKHYKVLLDIAEGNRTTLVPWMFEPDLEKVLQLGYINSLCKRSLSSSGILSFEITDSGKELVKSLSSKELFKDDIKKIKSFKKKLKKGIINQANSHWEIV